MVARGQFCLLLIAVTFLNGRVFAQVVEPEPPSAPFLSKVGRIVEEVGSSIWFCKAVDCWES